MSVVRCLEVNTAGQIEACNRSLPEAAAVVSGKVLAGAALFLLVVSAAAAADGRDSTRDRRRGQLQEEHWSIIEELRSEVTDLSQQCFDRGLRQAATDLTAISLQLTTDSPSSSLPRMVQLPVNPALPPEEKLWRERLRGIREESGKQLYKLARSALRADLPTLAYEWVQDVIRVDPDHKLARSILGQMLFRDRLRQDDTLYAGEWVSPFEARMRSGSRPHVFDPRFGWIPENHLDRYEIGERPWGRNWISKEKEAELRRNFRNAWEVESEHFLVKTNTSLEEGVEISQKLEVFYDWLTTNFAAFFDTPQALEEKFEQAQTRNRRATRGPRMEVYYYAEKEEYEEQVRGEIPPNVETNGLYVPAEQTSYFFRSGDPTTVVHEATHQIFDLHTLNDRNLAARVKSQRLRRPPVYWGLCEHSNLWLIEGLACYFESFQVSDSEITVGDPRYQRFEVARVRLLSSAPDVRFYLPLQPFCALGKDEFQVHPNAAQLYSQASGVTHFLMHYDDGRYRDDLVRLLSAIYRPDLKNVLHEPTLEEITGVPFAVLDQQYREHMENLAIELAGAAEQ